MPKHSKSNLKTSNLHYFRLFGDGQSIIDISKFDDKWTVQLPSDEEIKESELSMHEQRILDYSRIYKNQKCKPIPTI